MSNAVLFGDHLVESLTVGNEVLFFEYEPPVGDLLTQPLWSVGDDDNEEHWLDNDCLSLYNEH